MPKERAKKLTATRRTARSGAASRAREKASVQGNTAARASSTRAKVAASSAQSKTATGTRPKASAKKAAPSKQKRAAQKNPSKKWLVFLGIALVILFLYEPCRNLYHAKRTSELLTQMRDLYAEQNAKKQEEVNKLNTEEGIRDEARLRNYVDPGETPVNVEGLEEPASVSAAPEDVRTHVLEKADPFYISIGDCIFGYNKSDVS